MNAILTLSLLGHTGGGHTGLYLCPEPTRVRQGEYVTMLGVFNIIINAYNITNVKYDLRFSVRRRAVCQS